MAGLTGPDNAEVYIEVGGELWKLRYPVGAIYSLQIALKDEAKLHEVADLIEDLDAKNLHLFVWAGRLHEDRALDPEKVKTIVDWEADVPATEWGLLVHHAWRMAFGTLEIENDPGKAMPMERKRGATFARLWSVLSRSRRSNSGGSGPTETSPPVSSAMPESMSP